VIILVILFTVGFAVLVVGAHYLVNGASSLAKRMAVPEIVIGLTVVAFGTSTPELVVNILSSLRGYNDVVFGNIIGSNIFNILVILGISGLVFPLSVQRNTVWKEIPFSLAAVLILLVLVNDRRIFGAPGDVLSRIDGSILLFIFSVFLLYIFSMSRVRSTDAYIVDVYPMWKTLLYIGTGFTALFLGGKFVVDNAIIIAQQLGVSDKLIALTVVAAGTSVPELATSTVAVYKKRYDIAVGNIVGSNIFNICFILGVSAMIRGATYNPALNMDLVVLTAATMVLFLTMFTGKKRRMDRWEAFLLLMGYVGYVVYLLFRR
jgi:cation:H+ antiporter